MSTTEEPVVTAEPAAEPNAVLAFATALAEAEGKLEQAQAQAQEYLELAQRRHADMENFRRRSTDQIAAARNKGASDVAESLIPVLDTVEMAVAHEQTAGIEHEQAQRILDQLMRNSAQIVASLATAGIVQINPAGEVFDPTFHEATALVAPEEDQASGICSQVLQCGYIIEATGRVIRPARVLVTS